MITLANLALLREPAAPPHEIMEIPQAVAGAKTVARQILINLWEREDSKILL
jgi:hypothetical protein